jgi:hypothetical protein
MAKAMPARDWTRTSGSRVEKNTARRDV